LTAPEPSQTPNRAAKTAREPFKQARLAPDPSMLGASRQAPQDEGDGARTETGRASWYDLEANTASGEAMDGEALTAAHPSLPFGSKVRVANLDNGRSVVVRINDRGPFSQGRIIDVSRAAAAKLGMLGAGVARVSVDPVDDEVASDKVASANEDASSLRR
jgi:rare lipoprotein A